MTLGRKKVKDKTGRYNKESSYVETPSHGKTITDSAKKNMEEISVKYTWYRFIELKDQKWVEFELGKMSSRDLILQSFSLNFQNQAPWGEDELKDMSEEGEMRKAIREA